MKFLATAFTLSLLGGLTQAWDLTIYRTDGKYVHSHGTLNSGCVTYDAGFELNTHNVNKAIFAKSTFAGTFELWSGRGCTGAMYRDDNGPHNFSARKVLSYKVY